MPLYPAAPHWVLDVLRDGVVIPAHPLALTRARKLDERHQRALTRYYHAAGAGGVAVGVHTTQFEIRDPKHGLFKPVLELASAVVAECDKAAGRQTVRIAGICGRTAQAVSEAAFARECGYHAGLLSLAALADSDNRAMLQHCATVAREIPIIGFYLQPAVGGRVLSLNFWRRLAEIPNLVAIKIAPFNRYQTLEVVRAVAESGRGEEIALYTGNDDHIVLDLLTEHEFVLDGRKVRIGFAGGLLGHWACWTQSAVRILDLCKRHRAKSSIPTELLTLAAKVTDCNAAFFDAANGFAGCIAGIHEVLRRQGLMAGITCLDPKQGLSPGQKREIDRVCAAYPELTDDAFVAGGLENWLEPVSPCFPRRGGKPSIHGKA
jgi:dihydrodipicolinate synthase/N-acetylneuraminate lyase